jgi:hypothetical protein
MIGCVDPNLSHGVLQLTRGRGVDVVFSTLSELSRESWDSVTSFGIMVQIQQGHSRAANLLQIPQSSRSRTFVRVDLEELRLNKAWECTR